MTCSESTVKTQAFPYITIAVLTTLFIFMSFIAHAQPPNLINYQGILTDETGNPMATNEYKIKFGIFTEPTTGTAVWEKTYDNVPVVRGNFNVILGPQDDTGKNIDNAFTSSATYLEITVANGNPVMPRQQILSSPYAFNASNGVPVATVLPFAGNVAPAGYLLCDGRQVAKTDYPGLFTAIGTIHGGDGNPNFNLPDLRGRFPMGESQDYALADIGGEKEHQLSVNEMPLHAHPYLDVYHSELSSRSSNFVEVPEGLGSGDTDYDNAGHQFSRQTDATGDSEPHNNLPPYLTLNFIIKY